MYNDFSAYAVEIYTTLLGCIWIRYLRYLPSAFCKLCRVVAYV
jgi:hypothetical protein